LGEARQPVSGPHAPHGAVEPLASRSQVGLGAPHVELDLGKKRLFVGQGQVVDGLGLVLLLGQLDPRRGRFDDDLAHGQHLLGRLHSVEGHLGLVGDLEHGVTHAQLGPLKLGSCDALARAEGEQREKILDQVQLEGRASALVEGPVCLAAQDRVLQQPGLHQVGLRDPQLFVHRLQVAVVEQRHLDGAVHRQLAREQLADGLANLLVLVATRDPRELLARAPLDLAANLAERRRGRGRGAARGQGRQEQC
jgi:hypothetical protein